MEKEILSIIIPLIGPRGGKIPISLNKFKPNYRSKVPAWAVSVNTRKYYEKYVPYTYEKEQPRANYREKRKIVIARQYHHPYKMLDEDNFKGGLKPLLDTLRNKNWIYDDDNIHLTCIYQQHLVEEIEYANQLSITVLMEVIDIEKVYNHPDNY